MRTASRSVLAACLCLYSVGALTAQSIPIPNASFKYGYYLGSNEGIYNQIIPGSTIAPAVGLINDWKAGSTTLNAAAGSFSPSQSENNWDVGYVGREDYIGYLQIGSAGTVSLSQTLTAVLQDDWIYTLGYNVGRRKYTPRFNYSVQLWAGSTLLVSDNSLLQSGLSTRAFFSYGSSPGYLSAPHDPNTGKALRVVLTATGIDGTLTEAFFDDIALYAAPRALGLPAIDAGGVVPIYSSSTTIQPGSWISIYGKDFAGVTTLWNGDFPTTLGGASVTINSKPAYLWSVSRTQINLQAPTDEATGPVLVTVTTPLGKTSANVILGRYGPSFTLLDGKHPAAIVATPGSPGNSGGGYDIIGPAGGLAFPTRPVKAGEVLVLYGVGFGPTNLLVPAGLAFSGAATSLDVPRITIGGVPATVNFSGIVAAGLFQINIVVPSTASGDQPLQAIAGGLTTQNDVFVTIQP